MPKLRKNNPAVDVDVDDRKANAYVKALTHPVRVDILREIRAAEVGAGVSPSDIQILWKDLYENPEDEIALGVISYHVRMLLGYGVIKLVRTEPRRGAVEHYYGVDDEFDLYLGETRKLLESL
jgi:DNA-binding transcriptional ArsR family regulator